jgi:hypothetical protein
MFSYRITSKRQPSPSLSGKGSADKYSGDEFKERVFRKSLRANRKVFAPGTTVKINGSQHTGIIDEVITEFSKIKWDNNKPFYLVVKVPDGRCFIAHPSQITKVKVKS